MCKHCNEFKRHQKSEELKGECGVLSKLSDLLCCLSDLLLLGCFSNKNSGGLKKREYKNYKTCD